MTKSIKLIVDSNKKLRANCPASCIIESEDDISGEIWLHDAANNLWLPGYAHLVNNGNFRMFTVIPHLPASCSFELDMYTQRPKSFRGFSFQPMKMDRLDGGIYRIEKNGQLFTNLYTKTGIRPFLMPIIGPNYKSVTREYPLKEVEGGTTDHIHHRSLLTAWGDINGYDNWSEHKNAAHQVVQDVKIAEACSALTHLKLEILWTGEKEDESVMDEERDIYIYNLLGSGESVIDFRLKFTASYCDVHFNDTKEAGLISVRVADSMRGKVGGKIANAKGKKKEIRCWGRKAAWCDYSGEVDGDMVGITVMDHPSNAGFPSRWHVREYGLMGANPWAQKCFKFILPEKSHTIKKGEDLVLNYRVYVHCGDAEVSEIDRVYNDFVNPAKMNCKK